jgi:hypothetical protein
MNNMKDVDRLIKKRWPRLKRRAQNESSPEKLIVILEEIEDLLFLLEMRIGAQGGNTPSRAAAVARFGPAEAVCGEGPGDSESETQ